MPEPVLTPTAPEDVMEEEDSLFGEDVDKANLGGFICEVEDGERTGGAWLAATAAARC